MRLLRVHRASAVFPPPGFRCGSALSYPSPIGLVLLARPKREERAFLPQFRPRQVAKGWLTVRHLSFSD
ncbi:MAG: hypothetical protein HY674_00920 [Chloroflexi bacterium]|nr:hypothetical protein [Chloroflexota bacterium]